MIGVEIERIAGPLFPPTFDQFRLWRIIRPRS